MDTKTPKLSRLVLLGLALLLVVSGLNLHIHQADAAQLSTRSITMSSAVVSATGLSYAAAFTTSASFQSLIIDFCADSPLIGLATCTTPTGLSVASSTVTFTSGTIGTVSVTGTTQYRLKVSGTVAAGAGNIAFTINNVTNPSAVGTFYARIYTYSNNAFGTPTAYSSFGSIGSAIDTGGIALSTASIIQITATVQETLLFCVSKAAPSSNCGGVSAPNLTLGSGSPVVLGTTLATDTAYMQLSTNAQNTSSVYMDAINSCSNGGLSSNGGTTCNIAGAGATAIPIGNGAGLIGMKVGNSTGGTGATLTAAAPYNTANYAMDYTTAGNNVTATFGDIIATVSGATNNMNSLLTFAASAANTTPAGIYTGGYTLVATGTF